MLGLAHKWPPWDSIILQLIDSPMPVPRGFAVKNASKRPDRRGLFLSWRHFLIDATLGLLCSIDFCGLSSIGLGPFHGPGDDIQLLREALSKTAIAWRRARRSHRRPACAPPARGLLGILDSLWTEQKVCSPSSNPKRIADRRLDFRQSVDMRQS